MIRVQFLQSSLIISTSGWIFYIYSHTFSIILRCRNWAGQIHSLCFLGGVVPLRWSCRVCWRISGPNKFHLKKKCISDLSHNSQIQTVTIPYHDLKIILVLWTKLFLKHSGFFIQMQTISSWLIIILVLFETIKRFQFSVTYCLFPIHHKSPLLLSIALIKKILFDKTPLIILFS